MANRYLKQFQYTFENDTVTLYGVLVVGASGAVTSIKGGGIQGAVKESTAGQYSLTLSDKYNRILFLTATVVDDAVANVATVQILEDNAALQADLKADKTLKIQCLDFAGAAVNPTSTAAILLKIVLRNTSVGKFD